MDQTQEGGLDLSVTQADLEALDAAIASGVLETRFADGRAVRYNTTGDLLRARASTAALLASQSANRPDRFIHPEFTRGT
jgi:hypothetical protein